MSKHKHDKVSTENTESPEAVEVIDRVEILEKEVAEWKDKYLRNMAEFENYRRRSQAEKADWIRMATQKLALDICDVSDNFERAMLQASAEELQTPFGKGVVMIEKQLLQALEKEGVTRIDALGKEFNPEFHDALAHIPSDFTENTIAAIIQNGYLMHDKVLRPVRVAVSNGNNTNNTTSQEE